MLHANVSVTYSTHMYIYIMSILVFYGGHVLLRLRGHFPTSTKYKVKVHCGFDLFAPDITETQKNFFQQCLKSFVNFSFLDFLHAESLYLGKQFFNTLSKFKAKIRFRMR